MASYRIGYDMTILWSINDRMGAAVPLEDKVVNLYYICDRGRFKADIQIQDGNVIVWDFPGIKQRYLGSYGLTVEILQSGGKRIIRKDIQEAFELVSASYMEKNDNGGANISDKAIITLSSELDIYRISPIVPEIGENNNWWVDGVDTGKAATINKEELDKKADKTELTKLAENLDKKADKTEIPTKLSDLEKDIDFGEAYYITSFSKNLLDEEIPGDGKIYFFPCQEQGLTEAIKNKKSIRLLSSGSFPEMGYLESVRAETDDMNYLTFLDGVHVIMVDFYLDGSQAEISRRLLITKDNINENLESDIYYITSFDYQGILRGILNGDNRIQCYEPNLYQAVKDNKAIRLFVDMRYHDGYYEASSAVIDDFIYLTFENETSKFILDILFDGSDLTFSIYDDTEIREELSKKLEGEVVGTTTPTEGSIGGSYDDTEIRQEIAELSAEVDGLSEKIENLPTAEEVFIAEYAVTTYEQIIAAYNEGKQILCFYDGKAFHLSQLALQLADKDAYFTIVNNNYVYRLICSSNYGTWRKDMIQLEKAANKTTTLSESSTDTQYPSAKAVYDFVSNTLGTIINGDY